jgi:hypothetical protein
LEGAGQREFPLNDPSIIEIFGYTEWLSYAAGESVRLFTHTTAPTYDIEVIRDGLKPLKVWSSMGQRGMRQQTPADAYAVGCRWVDPVVIPTAASWPSGFYLIILRTRDQTGRILEREAGFILRPPNGQRSQRLALIWTSATAAAYNDWGGANSYRTVINGVSRSILSPRMRHASLMCRIFPPLRHPSIPLSNGPSRTAIHATTAMRAGPTTSVPLCSGLSRMVISSIM